MQRRYNTKIVWIDKSDMTGTVIFITFRFFNLYFIFIPTFYIIFLKTWNNVIFLILFFTSFSFTSLHSNHRNIFFSITNLPQRRYMLTSLSINIFHGEMAVITQTISEQRIKFIFFGNIS